MSPGAPPQARDPTDEISSLIETLHRTEKRLEELTAGEVDTVADHEGRTFLLRRAQDQLRLAEAARQNAILNALPAHIALLDPQGVIISVNETWRRFPRANMLQAPGHPIGINYLQVCESAMGDACGAEKAAEGIRSVLYSGIKSFSLEYSCHSPTERRWFLLTVTPLADDRRGGAVVMHTDVTAHRQSEENLRASELRFRQMAENIRDVFFLIDTETNRVLYISPAYEEIFGRSCESVYTNPYAWTDAIHPDDLPRIYEAYTRGLSTGKLEYEYRIVRPDGSTRWMETRGFPVRDETGKTVRITGVAEDITHRKEAAQELHESERRFSDVLGNVELISLMLDREANITYCNDYLLRMTGWQREDVIGKNWFDLFIPSDASDLKALFASVMEGTPHVSHLENEILTHAGGKRQIRWSNTLLRSNSGKVIGTASIGDDITENMERETKLLLQSKALNAAANAMIITTHDFKIVWMNPAFTELTGYTEAEALGANARELLGSGVHDRAFYENITDTIFAGESWRGEMTNRRKDGRFYPEAQIITPVKDKEGRISHFIAIKTDLTAQRQMEAQLRQAQKMEAVGQLAAGVAHEFNNLLQALMSMAAITRLRAPTAELKKIGTEMEFQIRRGASLTQQLLLFSRHHAIDKSELDLQEQVHKASVLLRRLIPENIRIVVESSPAILTIDGDAAQMQQVLLNLAINARDAMPRGGTLTLRAGCSAGEVFAEVEDTGDGMDEATRARIFEPFFTTKEMGKGTGLGLAVVHGIVEEHGGRIDVESRLGSGSRFRVVLPSALGVSAPPIPVPAEADELLGGSGRVLLVEDEEGVRSAITALLEMVGYEVIAVASGEEATGIPQEPSPDLLLSDITLPGITGPALVKRLQERWPSLKIVLMSGYIEETLRSDVSAQGWQFLQKPFEMTDLISHLRAAQEGQAPGAATSPASRPVA